MPRHEAVLAGQEPEKTLGAGALSWPARLGAVLLLTRPRQWIKNGLVVAAALFGGRILEPGVLLDVSAGFAAFSALSAAVYAFNDIHDRTEDRVHPAKRHRPLASGALPVGVAWGLSAALAAAGLALLSALNTSALVIGAVYLALNVFYTAWAKNQVILDVLTVAGGFLLRVMAGGALGAVQLSPWLLACTLLLALTLALGKRRGELASLEANAANHRRVMTDYSARFLDQMIAVVGSVTITSYILYTLLSQSGHANPYLFASNIPVIYGLLRYFYLVYHLGAGESPESLPVNDRPLLVAVLVWGAIVVAALYR